MRTITTIVLVWLMMGTAFAAGVRLGMTRDQVEEALGRPNAAMVHGDRTILMYPEQGRVELIDGKVVEAAWVPIDSATEPPPPPVTLPPPVPPPALKVQLPPPPAVAAKPPENITPTGSAPAPEAAAAPSVAPATSDVAVPDVIDEPVEPMSEAASGHFWTELAIGAFVRLGLTMVVLKLAFKWADVHADWSQMVVPALADTVVRSVVVAGAYALWHVEELFYVDEALAYLALLFALMKTTHACTLQRAAAVAVAAKLASIVVWSLASVAVMRVMFG